MQWGPDLIDSGYKNVKQWCLLFGKMGDNYVKLKYLLFIWNSNKKYEKNQCNKKYCKNVCICRLKNTCNFPVIFMPGNNTNFDLKETKYVW